MAIWYEDENDIGGNVAHISELESEDLTYSEESTKRTVFSSKSVFNKYKDEILSGDFSFADGLNLDDNARAQLERYQEAFDCLGKELAFECFTNPVYITKISRAFDIFCVECKLISQRRKVLLNLIDLLPDGRAELNAYYFILAFTKDPQKRKILLSICPAPGKSVIDLVNSASLTDVTEFSLLEKFISWCAFDIRSDIEKLYKKIFIQPRVKTILNMRAANKTLEATGIAHRLTRERIRQIEMLAKRNFNTWSKRFRIFNKIAALNQENTALTPAELAGYFGDNADILIYLFKSVKDSNFCYDKQTDVFYIREDNFEDRLQNVLDELPSIIRKSDLEEIAREASKASSIPSRLIEKAITDGFALFGDTYYKKS